MREKENRTYCTREYKNGIYFFSLSLSLFLFSTPFLFWCGRIRDQSVSRFINGSNARAIKRRSLLHCRHHGRHRKKKNTGHCRQENKTKNRDQRQKGRGSEITIKRNPFTKGRRTQKKIFIYIYKNKGKKIKTRQGLVFMMSSISEGRLAFGRIGMTTFFGCTGLNRFCFFSFFFFFLLVRFHCLFSGLNGLLGMLLTVGFF